MLLGLLVRRAKLPDVTRPSYLVAILNEASRGLLYHFGNSSPRQRKNQVPKSNYTRSRTRTTTCATAGPRKGADIHKSTR